MYPTTWKNLFSLVEKMAGDKEWSHVKEEQQPAISTKLQPIFTKLQLRSEKERSFVLGFPEAGKERIAGCSYYALRESKGADWEYRQFLESSLSVAEHFSGDGTTKPAIVGRGKPPPGFPEFLGPNREVAALPEVAVIGLGALQVNAK